MSLGYIILFNDFWPWDKNGPTNVDLSKPNPKNLLHLALAGAP